MGHAFLVLLERLLSIFLTYDLDPFQKVNAILILVAKLIYKVIFIKVFHISNLNKVIIL